jgi:Ni,Fe-hydrogenase III large subunit
MRLVARFAKDLIDSFEVIDIYDNDIKRYTLSKDNPTLETLTIKYPAALWMEKKINDEFGIIFKNSFDTRNTIKHEYFPKNIYPMRKSFSKKEIEFCDFKEYKYEEIEGDSLFVVPVGPIHAGIIEPGHFQFSQAGEEILHLEVRHFYKYRAIEKMCEGKKPLDILQIISRVSGNESIAYQVAYRDILAQSSGIEIPKSLKQKYAILLELERIIHHLTDLGFIPNDAGFGSALAFMSAASEEARRAMKKLTNHRFGFDTIKSELDLDYNILNEYLKKLKDDLIFFRDWIEDIPSVWDRFDTTGVLSKKNAIKYGAVGLVARASGVKIDCRDNDFYKSFGYEMQVGKKGDVGERFTLRIKEIFNSIEMIERMQTDSSESIELKDFKDGEYHSFIESSIGELFIYLSIKNGVVDRLYIRDPSHINWQLFHTTIYKDIIADFPLINKSFDLSYAGNDL